jgi:protein-tyrosine phosphatase
MQGTPTRLEGAPNFREVGENTPGLLELKPRSLLRSSHLGFLKNKDTDTLKDLKISLLCDLRLDEERRSHPNRVDPQTAARTKNFCIMPGSAEGFKQQIMRGELTPERAHNAMLEIYGELASEQTSDYSELLQLIAEAPKGPILIHCAAGKDRTGWAIALILLTIGISFDAILADYLESQQRFPIESEIRASQAEWAQKGAPKVSSASLRPIYSVDERYLKHALTRARSLTGSLEAYLEKSLAVDIPLRLALQERFLRTR